MHDIGIVGAGIGGCTAYLFLHKHLHPLFPDCRIHIYESHRAPPTWPGTQIAHQSNDNSLLEPNVTTIVGGGLGLAPNGLRVLEGLDPELCKKIKSRGNEVDTIGAQTSNGTWLGELVAGSVDRYGHGMLLVMRQAIHDAVLAEIPTDAISFEKKVKEIVEEEGSENVKMIFEDGEVKKVDIVIGADGVWSKVKDAVPGGKECKPEYDGMVGIGCMLAENAIREVLSENKIEPPKTRMTMTFGPAGFFGSIIDPNIATPSTPDSSSPSKSGNLDLDRDLPAAGWWSTFELSPPPTSRTPFSTLKGKLVEQHKGWTPLISALTEASDKDESGKGTFVLPRWITPTLPNWYSPSGRVVVMGDAAHCMPPDSGQGVSCAVEDAMALGLIAGYVFGQSTDINQSESEKLKRMCELYEKVRKPRCEYIVAEARKRGNMKRHLSWWEQIVRNVFIWIVCRLLPTSAHDGFFSWDCEEEVTKVCAGQEVSVKGKGRVQGAGRKR